MTVMAKKRPSLFSNKRKLGARRALVRIIRKDLTHYIYQLENIVFDREAPSNFRVKNDEEIQASEDRAEGWLASALIHIRELQALDREVKSASGEKSEPKLISW